MFKIPFLTTFVPIKTLYDQIWNILVDQIYLIFEFFESEFFWRLLEGERCILEGWSWKSILFIMTFLITFISNIKLYNSIIKLFSILGENIKKVLGFSHFLCHFCQIYLIFSLFQKNYEGIFQSTLKKSTQRPQKCMFWSKKTNVRQKNFYLNLDLKRYF